ncbi:MAG: hypothetical protein ISP60_01060 [Flavobacteriaceae bacterium]|nr:hypothetical protein [Flavobacteriaceae bacterium]MBL6680787.1 hypothetical protein [Flavobacteriaceae bacterium]
MVKAKTSKKIRKAHRYLGLFLGIQFLFWTISGLYFSWTDLNEIHGDHFKKEKEQISFTNLININDLEFKNPIKTFELREIADLPYYFINDSILFNAYNGNLKDSISLEEAIKISNKNILDKYKISSVDKIYEVGNHHEYRGKPLPAFVISYEGAEKLKSYVSIIDGKFQTVRHRDWRWFDFLWMTHTMDYETRDDFNNKLIRAFSLLGLITVMSGFLLWFISSKTIRRIFK